MQTKTNEKKIYNKKVNRTFVVIVVVYLSSDSKVQNIITKKKHSNLDFYIIIHKILKNVNKQ